MKKWTWAGVLLMAMVWTGTGRLAAQHAAPALPHPDSTTQITSLQDFFRKGQFGVHLRFNFMETTHAMDFDPHWAFGAGGRLHFQSPEFYGFTLGMGGSFVFNLASSDLTERDPVSGKLPRWERQLFDLTDPENRYDIDGLEALYLRYRWKKSFLTVGRMSITTPLVNPHNGRMRPNALEGIWLDIRQWKKVAVQAGWYTRTSPRSTAGWYSMSEAIGIFGQGVTVEGEKAQYHDHLDMAGVGILGIQWKPSNRWQFQVWDYMLENVQNTAFFQGEYTDGKWVAGMQVVRQDAINQGGHEDVDKRYVAPGQQANLIAFRLARRWKQWELVGNYGYVAENGRYQFPRELGYDKLYPNIPRLRMEGLGGAHAISGGVRFRPTVVRGMELRADLASQFGFEALEAEHNKYQYAPITQLNLDARYRFHGIWEGVSVRALWILPMYHRDLSDRPDLVYYKAAHQHLNVILDIHY
ncbi:OprD family outer membrane porin [Pontibacter sp. G13]|uniref:OprD family outer membrane porin n=1 Tax=Pontibacter sp. G13 TaxID=3074898 RepID=UPI0028899367|nr:OprD family outer membrane porin [Pontibacter sp. G13]WNJ17329.1 OprD family outer membrane porin [Pontibacter sp. G13]